MKITMILTMLGALALLALLAGCEIDIEEQYSYTCKVDRVQGTFVTTRSNLKTSTKMVVLYRFTNGEKRTFMFPQERLECEKNQ